MMLMEVQVDRNRNLNFITLKLDTWNNLQALVLISHTIQENIGENWCNFVSSSSSNKHGKDATRFLAALHYHCRRGRHLPFIPAQLRPNRWVRNCLVICGVWDLPTNFHCDSEEMLLYSFFCWKCIPFLKEVELT